MDERCDWSELIKTQCAHCTGASLELQDTRPRIVYMIDAKYSGNGCANDGRHRIRAGEPIGKVSEADGGGWLCQRCLEQAERD